MALSGHGKVHLQMSAFGGEADIDDPLLTSLNLWVHALISPRRFFGDALAVDFRI